MSSPTARGTLRGKFVMLHERNAPAVPFEKKQEPMEQTQCKMTQAKAGASLKIIIGEQC